MKNQKIADYYDKFYTENLKIFSGEPLQIALRLEEQLKNGDSILEIGVGTGRNSLYFASKGFKVMALDISKVAIERLCQDAKKSNLTIKTEVADIVEEQLNEYYDAVLCTFTLHQIQISDALNVIRKIQEHTKVSGFNALTVFTKDGDFFRENPTTKDFYLDDQKQLEQLYDGWKILRSSLREGQARQVKATGGKMFNRFAVILAQKLQ